MNMAISLYIIQLVFSAFSTNDNYETLAILPINCHIKLWNQCNFVNFTP